MRSRIFWMACALLVLISAGAVSAGQDRVSEVQSLDAAMKAAPSSERAGIEQRAFDLVDSLSPLEARELYEKLDPAAFPGELVTWKLARLLLHQGKPADAAAVLDEYASRYPKGRFIADVRRERDLLAEIMKVDPVVLGLLLPMSGKYGQYGAQILRAVLLAIGYEVADPSSLPSEGVFSTQDGIRLVLRDTAGDAGRTVKAFDDLAGGEHVIAILGPVFAEPAAAAAARAVEFGVPLMTLSRKEGITSAGSWVFRNCLTNSTQGAALARFAIDRLGLRTFAIMYPNVPYGVELANFFWDAVESSGGTVVGVEMYEDNQTTFTNPAKKLIGRFYGENKRMGYIRLPKWAEGMTGYRLKKVMEKYKTAVPPQIDFDALFIPDYYDKIALVAPALAVEDVMFTGSSKIDVAAAEKVTGYRDIKTVQLLGGNGWNSEKLVERAGKIVDGAIFIDGFFSGSERPDTKSFVEAFRKAYQQTPGLLEAQAFDSTRILTGIIRAAHPATREAMRRAILAVREFPGASGRTSFLPNGEAEKELFLITVDKGVLVEYGQHAQEKDPGTAVQ